MSPSPMVMCTIRHVQPVSVTAADTAKISIQPDRPVSSDSASTLPSQEHGGRHTWHRRRGSRDGAKRGKSPEKGGMVRRVRSKTLQVSTKQCGIWQLGRQVLPTGPVRLLVSPSLLRQLFCFCYAEGCHSDGCCAERCRARCTIAGRQRAGNCQPAGATALQIS